MWKVNVAELNFGNATCSISMSHATGSLLLCEEVLNLQLFTCTPGDRKGSCFLIVLGVTRVWCFDFAVASPQEISIPQMLLAFQRGERLHK